jgi:hypothetical protein
MPGVNGLFVIGAQIPVDGWRFIAAVLGEAGTGSIFYQMVNYCDGTRERPCASHLPNLPKKRASVAW